MAIEVTIDFDSGCFLPTKKIESGGFSSQIGYFQNPEALPDICVFVDNAERVYDPPLKIGDDNSTIAVIHKNAYGSPKRDGVKAPKTFHDKLLHLEALYGENIDMDPKRFDSIFYFESGSLVPSMIKRRAFKESRKEEGGFTPTGQRKEIPPISHNVSLQFTLEKGEVLELVRNEKVLLSSEDLGVKNFLKIELPVENSGANRFYYYAFLKAPYGDLYWLPNDDDPPPHCPCPPCPLSELG